METKYNKVSKQIMELKDLISGPLVATIDADSMSTRRYLSYLYELAFDSYNPETGEVGNLRMLEFTYNVQDNGTQRQQRVSMKEADFDFDIQIIDAVSADKHSTFSLKGKNDGEDPIPEGVKLRVSMAASNIEGNMEKKIRQGLAANMKVKVKMQQADMPGGLSNLLNLTTNNLQIEDMKETPEEQEEVETE